MIPAPLDHESKLKCLSAYMLTGNDKITKTFGNGPTNVLVLWAFEL